MNACKCILEAFVEVIQIFMGSFEKNKLLQA